MHVITLIKPVSSRVYVVELTPEEAIHIARYGEGHNNSTVRSIALALRTPITEKTGLKF